MGEVGGDGGKRGKDLGKWPWEEIELGREVKGYGGVWSGEMVERLGRRYKTK